MRRVGGLFLFAILAGFCIGLGGTVFLRLRDAFPGGNVVGALLFTIGLFTICTRGYALFTGKACYLFENPWPGYLLDLLIINGYAKNPHQLGKYLALFLGVTVFIVSGMEHSVADMYYWSVSGVLYGQPGESLLRLVVISLGNVVGGVFFPVVESWKAKLEAVKAEVT